MSVIKPTNKHEIPETLIAQVKKVLKLKKQDMLVIIASKDDKGAMAYVNGDAMKIIKTLDRVTDSVLNELPPGALLKMLADTIIKKKK